MQCSINRRGRYSLRLLLLLSLFSLFNSVSAQVDSTLVVGGLNVDRYVYPQKIKGFEFKPGRMLVDSTVFYLSPPNFKETVTIDSLNQRLIFSRFEFNDILIDPPIVYSLEEYKAMRLDKDLFKYFVLSNSKFKNKEQITGGGALVLKVPWEIRNQTFRKIFGGGDVQLKVTGNISFTLSGQLESREGSAVSSIQQENQFRPKFDQQQRFNIEGHIGDKVKIEVQQNSQATFDLENNLKVTYTGYEDEIIQTLVAGNIDLSLPKTNYVTFSGKNKGLFGIKTILKMGNLDMTAIASIEKGEKQKISVKGGSSGTKENLIKDYNYITNTFFFVDTTFKIGWSNFDESFSRVNPTGDNVQDIEVYVSIPDYNSDGLIAWTFYDANDPDYGNADNLTNADEIPGERELSTFRKLDKTEYDVYTAWGVIRLKQPVANNQIMAIAYQTPLKGQKGDFVADVQDGNSTQRLILIKPRNMSATDVYIGKTWDLMLRNVYYLGASNIDPGAFKLSIRVYNENNKPNDSSGKRFINLMGLDRMKSGVADPKGDNLADIDNNSVFDKENGYLFFPALHPFNPAFQDSGFVFEDKYYTLLDDGREMYTTSPTNRTLLLDMSKFDIAVITGQSVIQTDFDLGFNILPGSESVKLDGAVLVRDKDYLIDYFSGQLHITTQSAQRENADIEIEYERGAIFQLDKKTLFGMNAQYHFNDHSFIGFTGMFLNKSTIAERVRVGQEPFRNFVWDVNAAFRFQPKFLTKLINFLPLIETTAPSELSFETEYAQVLPNPNTQNNESTGDNDGVAYIDDFEGSRRANTLGIQYKQWVYGSIPAKIGGVIMDDTTAVKYTQYQPQYVWYNPFDRVPIIAIWPERGKKLNSNTDQRTDVLNLSWKQRSVNEANWDKAWLGLMRSTQSFPDQQETKYIEMWIYLGDEALKQSGTTLHLDLGTVSEDYYIKFGGQNVLNTEDKIPRNNLLDADEDVGLDGIPSAEGGDPEDNWDITLLQAKDPFPFGVNGTEGNGQAQGSRYPDTEDLDADGFLNLANDYFTYEVKLDPNSIESQDFFSADNQNGWFQLRIPLKDFKEKIGSPDETFQQVLYYRFWLDELPQDTSLHYISIAAMDYVANEWKELGIAPDDSSSAVPDPDLFSILVYNTDENSNNVYPGAANYVPPPGVKGVVDPVTGVEAKEQSMVMRFIDLPSGYSAVGKKNLYETLNLGNYKRIKLFMHGDHRMELLPAEEMGKQLEFILKIGKDANNFYEYHMPIYPRWDEIEKRNYLDIEISELAVASFEPGKIFPDPNKKGAWFKAVGSPTLRSIRYLTFSVKNVNPDPLNFYTGEVWFDELRVSEVDKSPGSALRFKTRIKGADLFDVIANFETKDANFHTINEQNARNFKSGNLNYLQSQNLTVNFQFGKLFPEQSGIKIPITAKYSSSAAIPVFFPQTDKETGYAINDFQERLLTLFGLRELDPAIDEVSSVRLTRSIGARFSRKGKNSGWFTDLTIDQFTFDIDVALFNNRNDRTEIDDRQTFSNKMSYRIPWGSSNYIRPLYWARTVPLVKLISGTKIYFTPSITSANFSLSHDLRTNKLRDQTEIQEPVQNTTTTRSLNFEYKLLDQLSMKVNRSWNAKADHLGWDLPDLYENIFGGLNFGETTNIKQSAQLSFSPDLSRYFKVSYNASSSFDYKVTLSSPRQNDGGNALAQRISLSFKPNQLLRLAYNPYKKEKTTSKTTTRSNRGRRGRQTATTKQSDEAKKNAEKEENEKKVEEKGFSIPNPAVILFNIFDSWTNMKVDYNRTNNSSYGYLDGLPSPAYQFGITTEAAQVDSFPGRTILEPVYKDADNLSATFGIDIAKNVSSNIDYKWNRTKSWGVNPMKIDRSTSYFAMMFDAESGDEAGIPLPNWSFSLTGLEKLPLFKLLFKTVTITHSRNGDQKTSIADLINSDNKSEERVTTNSFSPFLGLKLNFTNTINFDAKYNISQTYSNKSNGLNQSWNQSKDLSVSVTYSSKGGFRIPIPLFGLDKQILKNQLDFSLTFSYGERLSKSYDSRTDGGSSWTTRDETTNWSLKPAVNFAFSKRVRGSLFYEQSVDQNQTRGTTTIKKFGINVNLEIRE